MSTPHHCGWAPQTHRPCRFAIKADTPPLTGPGKDTAHHTSVNVRGGGSKLLRAVHISDTHNKLNGMRELIPDGDLLIISGDATNSGRHDEYQKFLKEVKELPHRVKLFTPGNHERGLDKWTPEEIQTYFGDACDVLIDEVRVIDGLRVYGFPWGTMWGNTTWGYVAVGRDMEQKLRQIPNDFDVLVAHYPPLGILDVASQNQKYGADSWPGTLQECVLCGGSKHVGKGHWGMVELLEVCQSKRPAAMLFGHVHDQNGTCIMDGVVYSNGALDSCRRNVASVMDFWLPAESDLGESGEQDDQ